jgi:hypothetical protein
MLMPGKIVQFDDETFALVNLLRRERRRSFQQLADEAFRDLLEKHGHPLKLKDQLSESLDEPPSKPRRKSK